MKSQIIFQAQWLLIERIHRFHFDINLLSRNRSNTVVDRPCPAAQTDLVHIDHVPRPEHL